MGRRSKKEEKYPLIKKETLQSVLALVFFVLSIFLLLAFFGKAGPAGDIIVKIMFPTLGLGYFIIPLILTMLGIAFLLSIQRNLSMAQLIGAVLFFLSGLGLIDLILPGRGGTIGSLISFPISKLFENFLAGIILIAILAISSLIIFDAALKFSTIILIFQKLKNFSFWRKREPEEQKELKINGGEVETEEAEKGNLAVEKKTGQQTKSVSESKKKTDEMSINLNQISAGGKVYKPPSLDILSRDSGRPGVGDIKANANIIKRTLQNFGIDVEMDEITIGPTVTRYALKPAEGIKLSRIVGLQNDLSLALAVHPLRIEAPIPGKSLVGIEVPNTVKTTVGLGSLLSENEFQQSPKPLLIALGKTISGKAHFADLSKMPHLLIAGATGSGKSVAIHAVTSSLIYKNSPENLKFILIDPKRVELTLYNGIPHLLTPVLTDPKKAIMALKWAAKEMDRRYDILESEKVRDILSYHKNIFEPSMKKAAKAGTETPEPMPYIVIIIDELADIMSSYPRELEGAIVRLAQMSRAVGIHLILSTQRPSVNVITGLIKANISSRMALQVASQIDSRTILDMSGAEKLLGAGDMLYLSSEMSKPQRMQTAYISESEVKEVVKYLATNYKNEEGSTDNINLEESRSNSFDISDDEIDDDLYEEARELVIKAGKASTSYLQRRLRIGYARAARLIDMLEERGVVGAGEGSKPREVLGESSSEEYNEENIHER